MIDYLWETSPSFHTLDITSDLLVNQPGESQTRIERLAQPRPRVQSVMLLIIVLTRAATHSQSYNIESTCKEARETANNMTETLLDITCHNC